MEEGHALQPKSHLGWSAIEDALCSRLRSPEALARAHEAADGGWPGSTEPDVVRRRLAELDGLESRLAVLAEAGHGGGFLASGLADVVELSDPLTRVRAGGVLEPIDLAEVSAVVSATVSLSALLDDPDPAAADEPARALADALSGLTAETSLHERLQRSLDLSGEEPALADAASPGLKKARDASRQARRDLAAAAQRLVTRPDIAAALADNFYTEREGRVVLPIKSGSLSRGRGGDGVAGIIHGSSTSGQTFFVEPGALVEDNNRVRQAQARARAEERLVLAALSSEIRERAEAIAVSIEAMIRLDRIAARLALSQALEGVAPRVHDPSEDNAPGLSMTEARHPGMVLAGSEVVPNDIELPVGHGMVISGPNAGGKTVALKTVGLAVLMAQTGLRLPTSMPAHVPLYRHLVTDVGDDQSIAANLSTFTAHLQHVLRALRCADADGAGTLVLLDEVAVGTDPEQGAALAEAILTRLVDRGATLIATTHYERLKLLAAPPDGIETETESAPTRFVNAAVGFDLKNLAPTFKLVVGLPGSSSALAVAQRLGMPEEVLERARALVDDDKQSVDALLAQLEAQRVALDQTRQQLADERVALAAARARLDARERGEEESDAKRRARAHKEATARLGELETEIKRRKKALRQAKIEVAPDGQAPAADAEARSFSGKARSKLAQDAPKRAAPEGRPPDAIEVGDRVFVTAFDAEGDVVAVKGGKITVQLPNLKTTVGLDGLRPRRRVERAASTRSVGTPAPSRARRFFGADATAFDPGLDDVVDLRGQREQEAVTMMEVFLDRAVAEDRDVVLLRHGHGSGALRRAVREALGRLRHVAEHRPGLPVEGGDAVTVVWVRG